MERKQKDNRPRKPKILRLAAAFFTLVLQAALLFAAAGRVDLPRTWMYYGVTLMFTATGAFLLYKHNPELIHQRLEWMKKDTKSWDKVWLPSYLLMGLFVLPLVMGLDLRLRWSSLGIPFAVLGFVLFTVGYCFVAWAMWTNPYFEATVRIQRDRGQTVITTGPYKWIRHPGYLGGILYALSAPMMIGSAIGFIPVGMIALLLLIRTALEDKTLQNELEGYPEYTRKTKYRLFPGLW